MTSTDGGSVVTLPVRPASTSAGGLVPHRSPRRRVIVGVVAVVIGLVCGSAAFAALSPTLVTPDETSHIDYGYQVWHGQLPRFEDGIAFTPGAGVRVPGVQWEAHHPPLYYLLIAPAVGPLIDSDRWQAAVMAARAINLLIAAGCILALAWAGSLLTTRRRWAWAIAVPAAVAPLSPFMRVGGSAYNDNLPALLVVLSLGTGILVLRYGPSRLRLLLVAFLCGLGSLARANFVVTLIVVAAMVAVGVWLHDSGRVTRRLGRSVLAGAFPFAAALAASGWFYLRNIRLTGSWTGAQTEFGLANMQRHRRGLADVLNDPSFWEQQLRLMRHPTFGSADWLGPRVLLAAAAVGLVACILWMVRFARQQTTAELRQPSPLVVQAAIVVAMLAQFGGVLLIQVLYAGIGGATINRYLLPGLLPIGALLAAAVLAAGRRFAGLGLLVYLAFAWGLFGQWLWIVSTEGGFQISGSTSNDVPWLAVWAAAALLVVAVVVQAAALTDWSRSELEPSANGAAASRWWRSP